MNVATFIFVKIDIEFLSIPKLHPPLKRYFRIFAAPFSLLESHVYPAETKLPTKVLLTFK